MTLDSRVRKQLNQGIAIPAHPLALDARRRLDERRQRALSRYYLAAGAGGLAVGVHTTQFQIRDPKVGLFRPVLELATEEKTRADADRDDPIVRVAGICGKTEQAIGEAQLLNELGYHIGLLSLAAMGDDDEDRLIKHCKRVAQVIPIMGFYLQPSVGGRRLSYRFWRSFADIPGVAAIKIAPFNRYQTLDVVRAVADSGHEDIVLYTGNDDNIVMDLLTPYRIMVNGQPVERRVVGGLLGHWSVWTAKATKLLQRCHEMVASGGAVSQEMLQRSIEVTDTNAAFFDAANGFAGCIVGLHEILRRQGILEGTWCLDPQETFGPGQLDEIDRVIAAYPHLNDDAFVASHRDEWLSG